MHQLCTSYAPRVQPRYLLDFIIFPPYPSSDISESATCSHLSLRSRDMILVSNTRGLWNLRNAFQLEGRNCAALGSYRAAQLSDCVKQTKAGNIIRTPRTINLDNSHAIWSYFYLVRNSSFEESCMCLRLPAEVFGRRFRAFVLSCFPRLSFPCISAQRTL